MRNLQDSTSQRTVILALWVSLDALVGGPGRGIIERIETTMKGVVSTTDSELTLKLVDVRLMGNLRNRIVHGTLRNIDPFFSDYKAPPDWVQLLDDLVGEVLRLRLKLPIAGLLDRSVVRSKVAIDERKRPRDLQGAPTIGFDQGEEPS